MIIEISIINKRPTVYGAPTIICGNSGYTINFTFDEEWNAYAIKTARFVYAQSGKAKYQDVVFTGTTVEVPILSNVREVLVGVYAGDLKTTTPARIICDKSILCSDPIHEEPPEDVYNQLLNLLIAGGAGGGGGVDLSEYAKKDEVPTKVSQLQNDAGFMTSYTETDPTVPSWAKEPQKPSYTASEVGARPSTWTPTYTDVGADKSGAASSAVSAHNTKTDAHNDIRLLISALTTRLDALANSDDTTLDQMAEVVAYIKANRDLIEQITTGKVSVADIVNNLTTNVSNKPLSAAQGVALKALIDAITVPTKVSQLTNDKGYLTQHQDISGKLDASALPTAINTALAQVKASGEFDGEDGQRGTGLLPVTTAPSSYTTAVGGITPKYRMAISTIKTQAGVTEVLLGDTIRYSYYQYPIAYLDASYAYFTERVSIRGAAGATPVAGTDYFTEADKQEIAERAADLVNVPTNVSAFTNDAEYVSNKAVLVTEKLDSSLYGWTEGYCHYQTGVLYTTPANTNKTVFLEVPSNCPKIIVYICGRGDVAGVCFYDSAKGFISGEQNINTNGEMVLFEHDVPVGAVYFCVSTTAATVSSAYVKVEKYAEGVLDRIAALEALSGKANAITYGYATSNVLCIGDSLTAGAYYAGEANGLDIANGVAIAQNYPYYLGRMLHCRTTNAGTNGYSASDWYNRYINDYDYADYDTFIIWLGTNYGCTAMPTDSEISSFTPSSSASAATANQALYLIKIIQTIQAANPSCHIVLGTVFGSKSDKTTNNDVVAQIAEKYGCQLVDMSDLSYSNHPELHAGVNNPHFGKAGNIYIANRLAMTINDYIASNPSVGDFGTTIEPMPTLTANEKEEIVAAVVASLPVYSGEVV